MLCIATVYVCVLQYIAIIYFMKARTKSPVLERGADGKLRPKKKRIDINDLDADTLRKLGIDPNLSKVEIARKLKVYEGLKVQKLLNVPAYFNLKFVIYFLWYSEMKLSVYSIITINKLKISDNSLYLTVCQEIFGDDIKLTDGDDVIGTKGIDEFDPDMTDEQLAEMEDLDLTTSV